MIRVGDASPSTSTFKRLVVAPSVGHTTLRPSRNHAFTTMHTSGRAVSSPPPPPPPASGRAQMSASDRGGGIQTQVGRLAVTRSDQSRAADRRSYAFVYR